MELNKWRIIGPGGLLRYKRDGGSDVFFWVLNFQLLYFFGLKI